ncbi:MAG: hypothetical protein Q9178_004459 [Gyalolechia marmorata]
MAFTDADESSQLWAKEFERERAERARAKGFSCLAEYERHLIEEHQQAYIWQEEFVEEECAATGKTREQVMAELLGENPTSSFNLLPTPGSCDCEEHAFDSFCPQSLVDYRSMDIPAMMTFLSSQNHVNPEKIKLEEGDKSKRLEQEVLEHYWGRRSPGPQMKLPFWANADGVVQHIIHQDEYRNASASLSPSPRRTASLL